MRNDKPLVTVIVPAYNCEMTIERAINSLITQTQCNFKAIVVNDGSTDETLSTLKNLVGDDLRFSIVTQTNSGPGAARNTGIHLAKTEYVSFLDADDTFKPTFLETMLNQLSRDCSDIAVSDYQRITSTGKIIRTYRSSLPSKIDGITAARLALKSDRVTSMTQNKVFKRNLFREIRFPENLRVNEDAVIIWSLFLHSSNVSFVPQILFNYIETDGSTMRSFNLSRITDRFRGFDLVRDEVVAQRGSFDFSSEIKIYYSLNVVLSSLKHIIMHSDAKVNNILMLLKEVNISYFDLGTIFSIFKYSKKKAVFLFVVYIVIQLRILFRTI